ncbi:hypothetical protein B0H17DRAFT_1216905 [Mycena rosella]|uniref:Uncharacterized protein n=1 Tax=Mycena rosella TaxID=1033263 RepID=A0AAD7C320_MYCRO|nr:hypothetical protein B0H17DRAFT_1216905 [Mycena rosella]
MALSYINESDQTEGIKLQSPTKPDSNMPATIPNTLVVFGPSPESFFLGHGRRHVFQGVPEGFAKQVQGVELPITQTGWISFDPTGTKYVARNDNRKQFCHSTNISQELLDHLKTHGATLITLGPDDTYFIKHNKGWNARLPLTELQHLNHLKPHIGAKFDSAIRGLLFGHGQTHIFLLAGGFLANLSEETKKDLEHPLTKVLLEFDEGWSMEPGSTLCPYSDRYFFLKFKKPNDTVIHTRWCLPELMTQKLAELKELTESPEDQMSLTQLRMADMQRQQMDTAFAMQRMNFQREMNNRVCQTLVDSGRAIGLMAGDYVEYDFL